LAEADTTSGINATDMEPAAKGVGNHAPAIESAEFVFGGAAEEDTEVRVVFDEGTNVVRFHAILNSEEEEAKVLQAREPEFGEIETFLTGTNDIRDNDEIGGRAMKVAEGGKAGSIEGQFLLKAGPSAIIDSELKAAGRWFRVFGT
jgi:hypothetical protein